MEAVADGKVEIPKEEVAEAHAIREFVAWYCSEPRLAFNRTVVLRYRIHIETLMTAREYWDNQWIQGRMRSSSGWTNLS